MKHSHCPLCFEELEVVETTPCIACGNFDFNIEVLKQDIAESYAHDSVNFANYRAFDKHEIILCDLCPFDMSSFDPEVFGLEKSKAISPSDFQFLTAIENPSIERDKFCLACNMRLAYLLFVEKAQKANAD